MSGKKQVSFYKKAKRLGQQGKFGKGKELSQEEFNFFMEIYHHLKDSDFEDKETALRRFFKAFDSENRVKDLVSNQIVSKILDEFLPKASVEKIIFIVNCISQDLRVICTDPFASHVIQSLLYLSVKYYQKNKAAMNPEIEAESISKEQRKQFKDFLVKVSKFVFNNLEEFVSNTYASYVIRTVLEISSGQQISSSMKSSKKVQTSHCNTLDSSNILFKVPKELFTTCKQIYLYFTQTKKMQELITMDCSSAVLQTVLTVLASMEDEEILSLIIDHICEEGFDQLPAESTDCHPLFHPLPSLCLFEAAIECATPAKQLQMYETYCKPQMEFLMQEKFAYKTVQKLFRCWKNDETFDQLFDCVKEHLKKSLTAGFSGVLCSVVDACKKFSSWQNTILEIIYKHFGCSDVSKQLKIVACLLYLMPLSDLEEEPTCPISMNGSLIVQSLLCFNKPIKVIRSFCELTPQKLQTVACDQCGSRVFDAFATAPFVGEKSRETLVHKMKGTFLNLSCSKHGSRSVEAIWSTANLKMKTQICSELSKHKTRLREDRYGKFIFNNFKIHVFNPSDKAEWEKLQEANLKKRELLQSFLIRDQPPKKKKKISKDDSCDENT